MNGALVLDRRRMLASVVASVAGAGAPAFGRTGGFAATQRLIDGYVSDGKVPGAIVAIMGPGRHRPVWLKAGSSLFDGGQSVDERTLWRVYSMTKPVTGIAVMQQVSAGKLSIDTPISAVMPEFSAMRVLVDPDKGLESRPAEKPILVRHLLTHTAGFSYTIAGDGPLEKEYRRLGLMPMSGALGRRPGDAATPALGEYMRLLATLPLRTEPGSEWRYSIGLDVAGALLEQLTGGTLDRVFEEQLFGPLGMGDTGFMVPAGKRERLAGLYAWLDPKTLQPAERPTLVDGPQQTEWAEMPVMLAGGAGLVSSAADYARFAQMMVNEGMFEGRQLLPRNVARLAMANLMPPGLLWGSQGGNGAGGRAILFDNATNPELYRVGTWGWGGAAATLFHVDPVRGHAVVLMLQSLGAKDGPSDGKLLRALAADSG